jgi:hypothetical protein
MRPAVEGTEAYDYCQENGGPSKVLLQPALTEFALEPFLCLRGEHEGRNRIFSV